MDVKALKQRTELSRQQLPEKTDPSRTEPAPVQGVLHVVILQFSNTDPHADETRSFEVGIVVPKSNFPADPPAGPDDVVPSAFEFLTKPNGHVRLIDAFCEPDLRAKHYAQWLWDGTFSKTEPVFVPAMRVMRLYSAYGYLFCDYSSRVKYTKLLGGFAPSDCYINQVN